MKTTITAGLSWIGTSDFQDTSDKVYSVTSEGLVQALGKIETPAKGLFRIRLEDLDVKTAVFREIFPKGQGIVTNNQTKPTVQPRGLEDGVGVASSEGWPSRYCKTNH